VQCANGAACAAPLTLGGSENKPFGVAIDSANVYWTDCGGGKIMKCAIGGCASPTILSTGQSGAFALALDATHVYWGNQTGGEIVGLAK